MRLVFSGLIAVCFIASCANDGPKVTRMKVSSGDKLRDKYTDGYSYAEVDGVLQSRSDKKSEFAGKSFGGTSDFANKDYTKQGYASKRWSGNKDYGNKSYSGNTDGSKFQYSPSYVQDQARFSDLVSNAQGKEFSSNVVERLSASENASERFKNVSSWYAMRDNVDEPVILGNQPNGMTINQTREMLGREDN